MCQFIIWLRVTAEGLLGTPFYFLADQKCCFTAICGGVTMLSKISQFQNMTKIYHIEHKSQRYFHRDIFFFSTVAARMLRISHLIVIYKRPVYFLNTTMVEFYFGSTFLNGFAVPPKRSNEKNCTKVVRELVLFCMCRGLEQSLRLTST